MKLCTVIGDLSADRTSDQYPQVNVCSDCIEKDSKSGDSHIVLIHDNYDSDYSDECAFCGIHIDEIEEE